MPEVKRISSYSLFKLLFQSPLTQMKLIYLAWVSCLFMWFIKAYKLLCVCFLASSLLMHFKLMFKGALFATHSYRLLKTIFRKHGSMIWGFSESASSKMRSIVLWDKTLDTETMPMHSLPSGLRLNLYLRLPSGIDQCGWQVRVWTSALRS